ncbi:lasso peptide biosynthesis B2 protein [Tropicimonas sp. TH_r6]|uniref:lasso peptide biosynthesis B2 protein n=1 Tax=Tropicimonas sp. TH_r6 TaxID=3082085 RepID=UPI002952F22D|nr:lasso peptide biosynthesis B2 protein [Tropicimonas sp. TH_r6]MDV7141321.1 lasso peptide biosynthesis B2 protein [Tropicimonas sp. TH_r6]
MPHRSRFSAKIARASQMSRQDWRDLFAAIHELWRANRTLRRKGLSELVPDQSVAHCRSEVETEALLSRVSVAVERAARHVPWRSSCLVQAQAAQSWLAREGIASQIRFGLDETQSGPFEAHAWLLADGRVITGGEISHYTPFS